ncbi:hypothetical protein E4U40_002546 [Claviceps sp. LM458 group G5]|nr:hypothetical protein E4U40_002546 [Claviceps sp. LM458 group G5]
MPAFQIEPELDVQHTFVVDSRGARKVLGKIKNAGPGVVEKRAAFRMCSLFSVALLRRYALKCRH